MRFYLKFCCLLLDVRGEGGIILGAYTQPSVDERHEFSSAVEAEPFVGCTEEVVGEDIADAFLTEFHA